MTSKAAFVVTVADREKKVKGAVGVGGYEGQRVDESHPCVAASFTNWQIDSKVAKIRRNSISTGYLIIVLEYLGGSKGTMTSPYTDQNPSFIRTM